MNQFVDERFIENVQRLALGLEPIDSERQTRIGHPLQVTLDTPRLGLPRLRLERHSSCLYALRYSPGQVDQVEVQISDPDYRSPDSVRRPSGQRLAVPIFPAAALNIRFFDPSRRFVPRRMQLPMLTATVAETQQYTQRVRRPTLFPGAAYDVSTTATGLRGLVKKNGSAVRWTRVEAALPGNGILVGRAHGDDRGEFLLLIRPNAIPVGDLPNPLSLQITIFAPATPPVPDTPDLPQRDRLWDLPLEVVPAPGAADPVSAGEVLPAGYAMQVMRTVDCLFGRLRSDIAPFTVP